jgi:hypothetical protein
VIPQHMYLDKLVVFSPEREDWMKSKHYRPVGTVYIVGLICRRPIRGKFASLFEIRWLDSQFQIKVEHVSVGCATRGIENYEELTRSKDNPDWHQLVTDDADDDIDVVDDDELQVTDSYEEYDPGVLLPTSLEEVEAIQNLRFKPNGEVDSPTDLNQHPTAQRRRSCCQRISICLNTRQPPAFSPTYISTSGAKSCWRPTITRLLTTSRFQLRSHSQS